MWSLHNHYTETPENPNRYKAQSISVVKVSIGCDGVCVRIAFPQLDFYSVRDTGAIKQFLHQIGSFFPCVSCGKTLYFMLQV